MSLENYRHEDALGEALQPVQDYLDNAGHPPMGLEGLRRQIALEQQALTDPLTGLYNRRAFEEITSHRLAEQQRNGQESAFIMFDLDNFKGINDNFGHDVGDRTLQRVAKLAKASLREGDILARLGGDEFAVYLPNTDEKNGKVVGLRLISLVGDPGRLGSGARTSVGLALTSAGDTVADALKKADEALYGAKQAGRNQLKLYSELSAHVQSES